MVEIVLHRIPGAQIEVEKATGLVAQYGPIFNSIPEGGITPEALFDTVTKEEHPKSGVLTYHLPHQFFLAIVALLEGGFISTEVRQLANA